MLRGGGEANEKWKWDRGRKTKWERERERERKVWRVWNGSIMKLTDFSETNNDDPHWNNVGSWDWNRKKALHKLLEIVQEGREYWN